MKIGFVGVGRMGANMARRLKDCGGEVVAVADTHAPAAQALAGEIGARACPNPGDVAARCDVVFTVVSDDAAMLAIFGAEPGGLLAGGAAGKIFVNCATVAPATHLEVERRVLQAGGRALEACMASSIPQARAGTLYLMCAGARETFEQVRPVLEKLSSAMRFVGPTGEAAKVKALVNMVMNINTAGLAEGLGLGAALGLDLTMLREVFAQTGAASQVLKTDGEDMQNREHGCFFSAAHAAKDSRIAHELGLAAGLDLPLARATREQYERLVALGLGELDKSGVAEITFKGRHA